VDRAQDVIEEFEQFTSKVRPRLRQAAFLMCGDWHVADDATQTVLLKVFLRWERLRDRQELSGYLRRALIRQIATEYRRAWRRHEHQSPQPEMPSGTSLKFEERDALLRALRRLGPRQRAVIVLRYWEDLTVEQTAEALHCAPGTVMSQSSRALKTLRSLLGGSPSERR
jgi:RNA polymerase sigma-70 factor (sigma-E family)